MYNTGRIFSKKVTIDGITFDSEMESLFYSELKAAVKNQKARDMKIHERHILQEEFINANGKKFAPLIYESDFEFYDVVQKKYRIIDVKGMLTDDFKIKWKLFDYKFKSEGISLEVLKHSKTTGWVNIEDYKKIMKTRKQQLVAEKNNYKKQAEALAKCNERLKKDFARYFSLKSKKCLTKAENTRYAELQGKLKDYIRQ